MPLRMLVFVVLYLAAVVVGRATRLEGTGLALVWPAAGVAFIWLADVWRHARTRHVACVLLLLATVGGNWATGAPPELALAFGLANLAQTWVSCMVFIRMRPEGWALQRSDDVRALFVSAVAG